MDHGAGVKDGADVSPAPTSDAPIARALFPARAPTESSIPARSEIAVTDHAQRENKKFKVRRKQDSLAIRQSCVSVMAAFGMPELSSQLGPPLSSIRRPHARKATRSARLSEKTKYKMVSCSPVKPNSVVPVSVPIAKRKVRGISCAPWSGSGPLTRPAKPKKCLPRDPSF